MNTVLYHIFEDQELLDEISDNEIEDIEDDKKELEDEAMEADDDEDLDDLDGEMTEEKLAAIKVIIQFQNFLQCTFVLFLNIIYFILSSVKK